MKFDSANSTKVFDHRFSKETTGSHKDESDFKEINYPFGKYEIKVILDKYGKFMRINEIKVNKDFRSIKQKIESTGFIDIEDSYKED